MTELKEGLPVPGYRPQNNEAIGLVTHFKHQEERLLRLLDGLAEDARMVPPLIDGRWLAIGRTHLEQAFMALNRSVFRPTRVDLPAEQANLGLATNTELEAELAARTAMGHTAPGYRTVDEGVSRGT
jgi:hypothetical protein